MKKTMKTAIALLSAVTMLGTCAVPAFAGELSKEELIQKYAPSGAYAEDDIYTAPNGFPTVMADGSLVLEHDYVQKLEASGLSAEEQLEKLTEKFSNSTGSKVSAYNDFRRGSYADGVQYFVNAEYENGFWYVLREDGTASIVGADQVWVAENSPTALHIPAEIGGAVVTKIEDGAFAFETRYNHDIKEITIPDTVEIIGDSAFNSAMSGADCKINLPQNVKYIGRLAYYGTMRYLMNAFNVITIPESVEFIGSRAFDSDSGVFGTADARAASHMKLYNGADYILDMPDSLVYCELNDIYMQDNRVDEEGMSIINKLLEQWIAENEPAGQPIIINANNEFTFKEQAAYLFSDEKMEQYADSPDFLDEFLKLKEQCEAFIEAYDTDRMPRDQYALYDHSSMFLYNEYNLVTLKDVAEYYNKLAAKPAPVPAARLAGDVDCSGKVDVSDAVLLARFVNQDTAAKITDEGLLNADADGSGSVTADDVTAIQRIIAKL